MKINKKELIRSIKFTLFSISAGIIEILLFAVLDHFTNWEYWPCYLIALIASVIWNFTLNREYTFKSANNIPIAMLKVTGYYLVFTPTSTIFGNYLAEKLMWNGIIVTLLNMILNFITEYLFDMFIVFRGSIDEKEVKKMNKTEFIKELSIKTGLDESKCTEINSIIEDTFLFGKKSKEKMIEEFKTKLGFDEAKAETTYETAMGIITTSMKNRIKHPFGK